MINLAKSWTRAGLVVAVLLLGSMVSMGCGGVEEAPVPYVPEVTPPEQIPDPEPVETHKLTIVGWTSLYLVQGQKVTLQVLYTRNGQPEPGQPIAFALKGGTTDATLSAAQISTNSGGFADVVLTAGQLLGQLTVEATSLQVDAVQWAVEVREKPETTPPAPNLDGTYGLTNKFDVQTNFTGSKFAGVLNVLSQISDDPLDPGKYVVDRVLDEVDNKAIQAVALVLKPALYKEVNKLLYAIAPKLTATFKQLAKDLSTIARQFEVVSTLTSPAPQPGNLPMVADHELQEIAWTLGGTRAEVTFKQLNLQNPIAKNVQLTLANGTDLSIREHTFQLNYGAFLLVALDNLVIPRLEPGAKDLEDLLQAQIDCVKVGQTMNKTIGLGGAQLWVSACNIAVTAVATYMEYEIAAMDSNDTSLTIKGQSKIYDPQKSGTFSLLTKGLWSGTLELQKCKAAVGGPDNRFWGKRTTK
jgi:hypothetical protein